MLSESEEELDFEEQVDLFHGGAHGGPIDHHMEQALLFGDNVDVGHFPMEGDEGGEPLVGQNPPDQPPDEAEQPLLCQEQVPVLSPFHYTGNHANKIQASIPCGAKMIGNSFISKEEAN